jgi:hypothetical protein
VRDLTTGCSSKDLEAIQKRALVEGVPYDVRKKRVKGGGVLRSPPSMTMSPPIIHHVNPYVAPHPKRDE